MHILFHRHTPWQGQIRCSTNIYAEKAIQAGYNVTYLEKLLHPGLIIKGNKVVPITQKAKAFWVRPFTLIPHMKKGIFSRPLFAKLTYKFIFPNIAKQLKNGYGKPDVIWTVPFGSSTLKSFFPDSKLIIQVVDYYPAFMGDKIKDIEIIDYTAADFIFTIGVEMTRYLVDELKIDSKKITTLGQGVDYENYQKKHDLPAELKGLNGPKVIWVGLLSKLDEEYTKVLIACLEQMGGHLILIGPDTPTWLDEISNKVVHNLGPKFSNEVPAYLSHCNVGMMLYDLSKQDIYKGQHPLKLYEYAAAGLGILSTPHDEYKTLNPPCEVINSSVEISLKLDKLLDLSNSEKEEIKQFAAQHSWTSKFKHAIEIISNEG